MRSFILENARSDWGEKIMAIFPVVELEPIVQSGDKTRLDATKSFVTQDEGVVTDVEIEAEAGAGFISVFNSDQKKWYLDWIYSGVSRSVTVSVRVTTTGDVTSTGSLAILSNADDKLFSSDGDLIAKEGDILKWVKPGRSSFLNVHRQAQVQILQWLDEGGLRNSDGSKISKDELLDLSEISGWSRDLVLHILFQSFSNQRDDIFASKADYYKSEYMNRRDKSVIMYDWNKDGQIDIDEGVSMNTRDLIQR